MNPLSKSKVQKHRETLKPSKKTPTAKPKDDPAATHKEALGKRYDSSGDDKHGYKTEPSPNSSPSIKFIPQSGLPFSFPYAYLQHWFFEQEKTLLILIYSQGIVKISGGNLEELFNQLNQYKVKEIYITEKSANSEKHTSIESITVERNREVAL